MHNDPEVSILMPVYNGALYIKEAIDSILAQYYSNFELIILNDGSTDETERIVKSYTDSRIRYCYHSNMGVAKSLNRGIELASGTYIRRHDADDISSPNALAKQISFIQTHPEYQLIGNSIAFMSSNGKIANKYRNPNDQFFNNKEYIEIDMENYWASRPIIHATILAEKQLFDHVGGYRPQFPTAEDIDLWLRILENHKVAVLNEVNYFVRLHSTSNTSSHGNQNAYYRNLAYSYFIERQQTGTDPIMRGEKISEPPPKNYDQKKYIDKKLSQKGKLYRSDILDFKYRIYLNAADFPLIWQSIRISLSDGWKLKQTWQNIIFPILGGKIVKIGVMIKGKFK